MNFIKLHIYTIYVNLVTQVRRVLNVIQPNSMGID